VGGSEESVDLVSYSNPPYRTKREEARRIDQMLSGHLTHHNTGLPVVVKLGDGRDQAYKVKH
jgi:hypothetical protein